MSGDATISVSSPTREDTVRVRLEDALAKGLLCRASAAARPPWWQFQSTPKTYLFAGTADGDQYRASLETASEHRPAMNRTGEWTDSLAGIGRHRNRQYFKFVLQVSAAGPGSRLDAISRPTALARMPIPLRLVVIALVIAAMATGFLGARPFLESSFNMSVDVWWLYIGIALLIFYAVNDARVAAGPELTAIRHVLEVVSDEAVDLTQVPIEYSAPRA